MEEDTHQPNELNSQMRFLKMYLKARYRLSDLLRAHRNDRMTSNLKRWIENGAPDKRDLEEDSYRIQDQRLGQGSLSGESDIDEKIPDEKEDLENKVLSGEFRWMRRRHRTDPDEETCSIADSSLDDNSQNSGIDTYSGAQDRNCQS